MNMLLFELHTAYVFVHETQEINVHGSYVYHQNVIWEIYILYVVRDLYTRRQKSLSFHYTFYLVFISSNFVST